MITKEKWDELVKIMGIQTFELKTDHLKLLREAYVDWEDCEFGAPAIDCKRPYGNSDVFGDITEILGVDLSEESMMRLHKETQMALQVILSTQSFELGVYEAPCHYDTEWRKKRA